MTTPLPDQLAAFAPTFVAHDALKEIVRAYGAAEYKRGQAEKLKLTDDQIEAIAVKHEAFGFGLVDAKGYTTHGFYPDGLREFVRELLGGTS